MSRLPVAVVGVGHLGKEHARILATMPEVELVGVVDPNTTQADAVAQRCNTHAFSDHHALISQVRAAVIAAPTMYHHAVARDFLAAGLPLLVEKPLASNLAQADDLVTHAEKRGVLMQVGHIERFNPAFEELQARAITPRYLAAERCGSFTGRSTDVGVVLDLMIHDLDLVLALARSPVSRVEAVGVTVLGGHEDMAQARVTFTDGSIADLTASRIHPVPVRQMRVWAAEGFAQVDFGQRKLTLTQPGDHLRRVDSRRLDPALRESLKSELFTRHLLSQELDVSQRHEADQLTRELKEFVACVRTGRNPRVDGRAGRAALALADAVLDQIRAQATQAPRGRLFTTPGREAA